MASHRQASKQEGLYQPTSRQHLYLRGLWEGMRLSSRRPVSRIGYRVNCSTRVTLPSVHSSHLRLQQWWIQHAILASKNPSRPIPFTVSPVPHFHLLFSSLWSLLSSITFSLDQLGPFFLFISLQTDRLSMLLFKVSLQNQHLYSDNLAITTNTNNKIRNNIYVKWGR